MEKAFRLMNLKKYLIQVIHQKKEDGAWDYLYVKE